MAPVSSGPVVEGPCAVDPIALSDEATIASSEQLCRGGGWRHEELAVLGPVAMFPHTGGAVVLVEQESAGPPPGWCSAAP